MSHLLVFWIHKRLFVAPCDLQTLPPLSSQCIKYGLGVTPGLFSLSQYSQLVDLIHLIEVSDTYGLRNEDGFVIQFAGFRLTRMELGDDSIHFLSHEACTKYLQSLTNYDCLLRLLWTTPLPMYLID